MGKIILEIYVLVLFERVCNFLMISTFSKRVLVIIIIAILYVTCSSTSLLTCSFAESLVKSLTRIQLPQL